MWPPGADRSSGDLRRPVGRSLCRMTSEAAHLRRIRIWLTVFVIGLVVSGVTAFPLETETRWLGTWLHRPGVTGGHWLGSTFPALPPWIDRTHAGLADTNARYPFLAYGTDWLGFAHLTIAVAFYGPLRDPVRNKWVVQFGLIACAGVVPLALICAPLRGIPFGWSLVDMSFGLFGALPLLPVLRRIRALEVGVLPGGGAVEASGSLLLPAQ
jgi:hypothetical protein